jgi:hypothetical protein
MAAGPTVSRRMPRVTMLQPIGQPLPSLPCCTAAPPTHAPPVPAAARSLSAARQSVPGPPPCCVDTVGLDPLYFAPLCPLFNPRVAATSPLQTRLVRQHPPPSLKMTLMAGHLGALLAGSTASTTEFEDNVDGGHPGGAVGGCGNVHQRGR